jgi:hypothetical protein
MFTILTVMSCIVACVVLIRMMNETTRERINVDRMRYVSLSPDERHIAQKYDARLMPRRSIRDYRHG